MLPKMSGLDIISKVREENLDVKIIILSAKSEEETKVLGLTIGADDYVTNPFYPNELVARVKASLRRVGETIQNVIEFKGLKYDLGTNIITYKQKSIKLNAKEGSLIEVLIKAAGAINSKEILYDKILGFDIDNDYNAIEVYISFLRKKLKHISSEVEISVSRGLGYYLEKKI